MIRLSFLRHLAVGCLAGPAVVFALGAEKCTRCDGTGRIGNMELMGNRVDPYIPKFREYEESPCPRCARFDKDWNEWWHRTHLKECVANIAKATGWTLRW